MRAPLPRPLRRLLAASMLAIACPVAAAADVETEIAPVARELVPLEIFQRSEERLFRVGYQLATANAPYCERAITVSGLLIHDADSYGNPKAVRALFRLSGDIGVQAVAPGSPAAEADIGQNDTILAIAGNPVANAFPPTDPRWERGFALRDAIDAALARGPVAITWQPANAQPRTTLIEGVPACPTRFELVDSKNNAAADGNRVLVGEKFPGLAYDEAAFAAAIAHEMAHNILRHPQTFAKTGWKRKLVRLSERDADRLMPWLLHNAGYDPRAAARFMRTWGPKHGGWIFRKRTHDGWDERVEFIEAEIAKIDALPDAGGPVDWKTHFVSELAPVLVAHEDR